ncbi:MAG: glycosyltransferase [Firmicutes bacterium]|nr:glycosyltransferase [Bacillota bacterium]
MSLVSIVLPTYNRAHVLPRAITSIFRQNFSDWELIVVDDGSTDDTRNVLQLFNCPKLRVVALERNYGPAYARNVGIRYAKGEIIAFQDSDDEWLPDKLSQQVSTLLEARNAVNTVGACYSQVVFMDSDSTIKKYWPELEEVEEGSCLFGVIYPRLLKGNIVDTTAMVVFRDVIQQVGGFDEDLTYLEDWDLALRIAKDWEWAFVPRPTVLSYFSPNGVNSRRDPISVWKIVKKHLDGYAVYSPKRGADWCWYAGDLLVKQGHMKLGREAMRNAWRLSHQKHIFLGFLASHFGSSTYRRLSELFSYSRRYSK